jgi:ABC-2 type transport system ATP-binding protein
MSMALAVETKDLTRVFKQKRRILRRRKPEAGEDEGPVTALDRVDMEIRDGELFGLLGPNGAGKTTLIKILATLLLPTSGIAKVAGYDVSKDTLPIRTKINMVSGGESSGYGLLTARENVWMFSQFYGVPSRTAKARVDEMFHLFGLWDKRNAKVRTLSSGQRQKMNMVRGFVTDPDIIFLDEPTLGLDVNASRVIREYVKNWVKTQRGKTVLLTTHYMMEADEMCDRLAIIDKGRILAVDTPDNLKRRLKKETTFRIEVDPLKDASKFKGIPGVKNFSQTSDPGDGGTGGASVEKLTFILEDEGAVSDIMSEVVKQGSKIHYLHKSEPTLEDVFISMVGRGLE